MGYGLEVDMIRLAHERDLLTAPYVFNAEEATAMAEAGADVLVPHMGLTTGGAIGARDGEDARRVRAELVQAMHDAAKRVNPDVLVLCHGGPIAEPDDAAYVLANDRGRRRLLRRRVDGAPADRGRDDREHAPLQGDPRQWRKSQRRWGMSASSSRATSGRRASTGARSVGASRPTRARSSS